MMPESANQAEGGVVPEKEGNPSCFGDPNRVCPKDDDGFIQPQAICVSCQLLRSCLQQALRQTGVISSPSEQQQLVSKTAHFLKRWSNKKLADKEGPDRPT